MTNYQIFYKSDPIGSKRSKLIVLSFTTYKKQQKPLGLTLFKAPFKVPKQFIKLVFYLTQLFWQWKNEGNLHGEKKVTTTTNNEMAPQSHHFQVLKLEIDNKVIFCTSMLICANHTDIYPKNLKKQNRECCQIPDLFNSHFSVFTLERWYHVVWLSPIFKSPTWVIVGPVMRQNENFSFLQLLECESLDSEWQCMNYLWMCSKLFSNCSFTPKCFSDIENFRVEYTWKNCTATCDNELVAQQHHPFMGFPTRNWKKSTFFSKHNKTANSFLQTWKYEAGSNVNNTKPLLLTFLSNHYMQRMIPVEFDQLWNCWQEWSNKE